MTKPYGLTDAKIAKIWADFNNEMEALLLPDTPDDRNVYKPESIEHWPGSGRDVLLIRKVAVIAQKKLLQYLNANYSDNNNFLAICSSDWESLLKDFGL